jgi:hypothetical protein
MENGMKGRTTRMRTSPRVHQLLFSRLLGGLLIQLMLGAGVGLAQTPPQAPPPAPQNIAGLPGRSDLAAAGEVVSESKLGSVLFYNYYVSDPLSSLVNTRFSITNSNPTQEIALHLFFVTSDTCTVADFFLCLTPNQTTTFSASDLDPGVWGYVIAIAVDSRGLPTSFNYLAGESYVVAPTAHRLNLPAIAAARLDGISSSPFNSDQISSTLFFNGSQYDYLPQSMMIDSFPSQISGVGSPLGDTRMYIYAPLPELYPGSSFFRGSLFFLVFDDAENGYSGQLPLHCYLTSDKHRITSVRTAPNLTSIVPPGRTGWARFFAVGAIEVVSDPQGTRRALDGSPLMGSYTTRIGAYNGGRNLRYLSAFSQGYSISVPVIQPSCGPTDLTPVLNGSNL